MFKSLLPILIVLIFTSCASHSYLYKIKLETPPGSKELTYENDTMSISFQFQPKEIYFKIYNKSEEGIKINWDEVSMSTNGKAQRVVHKETGTYRVTEVQPPTTIPPKTILEDGLIPTDNIRYYNYSGKTTMNVSNIYPTNDYGKGKIRDYILSKKGQRITIFLPYYIRNVYCSKVFNFLIDDIVRVKKNVKSGGSKHTKNKSK